MIFFTTFAGTWKNNWEVIRARTKRGVGALIKTSQEQLENKTQSLHSLIPHSFWMLPVEE